MSNVAITNNILKDPRVFQLVLSHYNLDSPEPLYKVLCPFHADRNASLQVNKEKCFWFCYGCQAKGGTLELVKRFNPEWSDLRCITFVTKLAKKQKVPYNNIINNIYNNTDSVKNVSFLESVKLSKQYYDTLPSVDWYKPGNNKANEEEARECKTYMLARNFNCRILTKAGAKPSLNPKYPICIPLLENGKFMGYVMRTFDKEIEQQRKYMYNRGFKRERTLAGNFSKRKPVLLVEGYLDCLKAQQFGIKNVVAILGWKISQTQIKKLVRYEVPMVICGLDGDEAGNKGYNYLKLVCKSKGIKLKRIHYPKGIKDFGDLKANSKELETVKRQIRSFEKCCTEC